MSQIYSSPDDQSSPIGLLADGESPTPIAETVGDGGRKWYLVRNRSGLVGWTLLGESAQSKKLEKYFKSLPTENYRESTIYPTVSVDASPRGSITVPVRFNGRSAIVSVIMNSGVTGQLLVDTGASTTVISQRLARTLSLQTIGKTTGHTVGGPISASVATLRSMRVGAAAANNINVLIHDFSPDPRIEGLLGMDFLGRYQVILDTQKQLLVLSPR